MDEPKPCPTLLQPSTIGGGGEQDGDGEVGKELSQRDPGQSRWWRIRGTKPPKPSLGNVSPEAEQVLTKSIWALIIKILLSYRIVPSVEMDVLLYLVR